jgi:hypothetical protein
MQHNGTAVLDRTEAAQVRNVPGQARPEPAATAHEALFGQVRDLPYGELAVALYASSMPTSRAARRNTPAEQIEAWAAEGLELLGAAQVWRLTWRTRNGTGPEHVAIWPSARREGAAYDMAWDYHRRRREQGHPVPHADWVAVEYVINFTTFVVQRDRRDLEYAQRYGWPSSVLVDGDATVVGSDRG